MVLFAIGRAGTRFESGVRSGTSPRAWKGRHALWERSRIERLTIRAPCAFSACAEKVLRRMLASG